MTPLCPPAQSKKLDPAALSILKSVLSAPRAALQFSLQEEGIEDAEFEDDFEEDGDTDDTSQAGILRPHTLFDLYLRRL